MQRSIETFLGRQYLLYLPEQYTRGVPRPQGFYSPPTSRPPSPRATVGQPEPQTFTTTVDAGLAGDLLNNRRQSLGTAPSLSDGMGCATPSQPHVGSIGSNPSGSGNPPEAFVTQVQTRGSVPQRGWPLIMFLHGRGESGSCIEDVAGTGLPKELESYCRGEIDLMEPGCNGIDGSAVDSTSKGKSVNASSEQGADGMVGRGVELGRQAWPFIVVAPQCPWSAYWTHEEQVAHVLGLLHHVRIQLGNVDASRMYLTGLSMGGFGCMEVASCSPRGTWAALASMAGGISSSRKMDIKRVAQALAGIPTWLFHGDADDVVPLCCSREACDALVAAGATSARLTVYPGVKHDSWTQTYRNPELYTWLLRHRSKP